MRSIEEFKQDFINGKLEKGLFTSINEEGQTVIVEVDDDRFLISVTQDNGWIRTNEYLWDGSTWDVSEIYDKGV